MNKELSAENIVTQKICDISSFWDTDRTEITIEELGIILKELREYDKLLDEFNKLQIDYNELKECYQYELERNWDD